MSWAAPYLGGAAEDDEGGLGVLAQRLDAVERRGADSVHRLRRWMGKLKSIARHGKTRGDEGLRALGLVERLRGGNSRPLAQHMRHGETAIGVQNKLFMSRRIRG